MLNGPEFDPDAKRFLFLTWKLVCVFFSQPLSMYFHYQLFNSSLVCVKWSCSRLEYVCIIRILVTAKNSVKYHKAGNIGEQKNWAFFGFPLSLNRLNNINQNNFIMYFFSVLTVHYFFNGYYEKCLNREKLLNVRF